MKLLIDGNNLIHYITRGPITKSDKDSLLSRLRRYSRFTGHEIIVVFDGGDSLYQYQVIRHGLCLWHSGLRRTADDVIKDLLPTYSSDEVLLITDDKQLNYEAQDRDIVSVSPAFFYASLQEKESISTTQIVQEKNVTIKTSFDANDELDNLFRQVVVALPSKEGAHNDKNDIVKQKKSSKTDRRLRALIRKL